MINSVKEGKEYIVQHDTKGRFRMQVKKIEDGWIEGVITRGVAKSSLGHQIRRQGEEVQVKDSEALFVEVG